MVGRASHLADARSTPPLRGGLLHPPRSNANLLSVGTGHTPDLPTRPFQSTQVRVCCTFFLANAHATSCCDPAQPRGCAKARVKSISHALVSLSQTGRMTGWCLSCDPSLYYRACTQARAADGMDADRRVDPHAVHHRSSWTVRAPRVRNARHGSIELRFAGVGPWTYLAAAVWRQRGRRSG